MRRRIIEKAVQIRGYRLLGPNAVVAVNEEVDIITMTKADIAIMIVS